MNKLALAISLSLATVAVSPLATAAPMDKKPPQAEKQKAQKKVERVEKFGKKQGQSQDMRKSDKRRHFSHDDQRLIRDYYQRHQYEQPGEPPKSLPPGLQKKYERTGQLPPGWQKKVHRGEVLPVDIYRYGREVPYDLRRQLPIGPVGSKILEIEGKIIRVMEGSRMILDVFDL